MQRVTTGCSVFSFCLLILVCYAFSVNAETLDTSFGSGGATITDFGAGDDKAFDAVVQADGKIVVAGYSFNGAVKNMAVARYLADGSLDPDFNYQGFATFSLGSGDSIARAVVVQEDGKIILVGSTTDGDMEIGIVRINSDGSTDMPFGSAGQMVLEMGGSDESATGVAAAADGTLFVSGYSETAGEDTRAVLVKVDPAGVRDTDFGDDGFAIPVLAGDHYTNDLVLLDDGAVLLAGSTTVNGSRDLSLVRFTADGQLDTNYQATGEFILPYGGDAELQDIEPLSDGGLIAVGYASNGTYREPLALGLQSDGTLDGTVGESGLVRIDLGYDSVAYSAAENGDATVAVAGFGNEEGEKDLFLLKLDGEGNSTVQAAGGSSDLLVTDLGSSEEESRAVALMPDGSVVAAGFTEGTDGGDFAIVRYSAVADDEESRHAGTNASGIATGNFYVQTLAIENVDRTSAFSGGNITERVSPQNCEEYCAIYCAVDATSTCYSTCYDECLPEDLTVVTRGVVYGITAYPSYSESTTTDDDDVASPAPVESVETGIFQDDDAYSYTLVRSGQTDDGSGVGIYGSDIYDITPGERYYVRAYAVLSDDTVIYGNQLSFVTDDACFIATAAFGSILDKHVAVLRQFRDRFLMHSEWGRNFVAYYYQNSPPIADLIREHDELKAATRLLLLPVIGLCQMALNGSWSIAFLLLFCGVMFIVPTVLLKKKQKVS